MKMIKKWQILSLLFVNVITFNAFSNTHAENKQVNSTQVINKHGQVDYAQQGQVAKTDSIVFEKTDHDYGTITQGGDGNYEFKFTNKGKQPLILNNVHASCGCTVPEWPKEPIAAGKTGAIKVRYNTAIMGSFNKSITVYSNAANPSVVLKIKGNIVAKQ